MHHEASLLRGKETVPTPQLSITITAGSRDPGRRICHLHMSHSPMPGHLPDLDLSCDAKAFATLQR